MSNQGCGNVYYGPDTVTMCPNVIYDLARLQQGTRPLGWNIRVSGLNAGVPMGAALYHDQFSLARDGLVSGGYLGFKSVLTCHFTSFF